jgi:putative ABC transport system permease protein
MSQKQPRSERIYRNLLRILPFDFRSEFGGEMELTFHEQRNEIESGPKSLLKMWWAVIVDLFKTAPREHFSVLSQDVRFAFRMILKDFGPTITAILILALGIGANTAIFSVVNSVLLKPLPYIDGNNLLVLQNRQVKLGNENVGFSVPEIQDYRQRTRTLTGLVEYHTMTFTLFGGAEAHQVRTGVVSWQFFDLFGVKPLLGRTFVAADEQHGANKVLILSYEFWKHVEKGDPHIIGKKYQMNDAVHQVIGVLPQIPQYPNENDVYMPTTSCPARSSKAMVEAREMRMMNLFGRLRPNETLEHSRSDVATAGNSIASDYPGSYPKEQGFVTTTSILRDDLTKRAKPILFALLGASGFLLLIACANVANLILARMVRREPELMIRSALGAGNGRLLRQLLTENFILTILAATAGLVFASGSLELLKEFIGQMTPRAREIVIDRGVLAFTILCAAATTIIFGSVAALHSRQDLSSGLKEAGRTGSEGGSEFVRRILITAQMAFSFILLIAAGLLLRSFVHLIRVDPGFVPQRVYAVSVGLNGSRFVPDEQRLSLAKRILQKLQSQPGVMSAAVSSSYPFDPDNMMGMNQTRRFQVEGDHKPENELPGVSITRRASPDYFQTLGIPLIAGRTFRDSDDSKSPMVVVMNRALALKRFGNRDPIGKRISFDNEHWATIIGIVGDVKEFGLNLQTPYQLYLPLFQEPNVGSVLIRTIGDPTLISEKLRRALHEVEPQMAIASMVTMEQARAASVSSPRTLTHLFALFAVLALVIAVAGIGSMLALWVKQRMHEIGVRMAFGATPQKILITVIQQGMFLVILGLSLGILGSLAVSHVIKTFLFQVQPGDFLTYLLISGLLLIAALIACYIPARRAMKVDPMVALRYE